MRWRLTCCYLSENKTQTSSHTHAHFKLQHTPKKKKKNHTPTEVVSCFQIQKSTPTVKPKDGWLPSSPTEVACQSPVEDHPKTLKKSTSTPKCCGKPCKNFKLSTSPDLGGDRLILLKNLIPRAAKAHLSLAKINPLTIETTMFHRC